METVELLGVSQEGRAEAGLGTEGGGRGDGWAGRGEGTGCEDVGWW